MAAPIETDVIVVGGGPAGLMAASEVLACGRTATILEKQSTPGKKLLISGGGRCNLTNTGTIETFLEKFSPSGVFLRNAFARFFNDDLMRYCEERGVPLKRERGGRVFPVSERAADILQMLVRDVETRGGRIIGNERVSSVARRADGFLVSAARSYHGKAVLIATGGASYPLTGSTGDGYALAQALGHTVVPARPALVPLETDPRFIRDWQGIAIKNCLCSLFGDGRKILERFGELLFTHFGLSGPVILDMSAAAYDALQKHPNGVELSINFKPALDREKLDNRLLREFAASPQAAMRSLMHRFLPRNMAEGILAYARIPAATRSAEMTREKRTALVSALTDFRMSLMRTRPLEEAIVTRGGVLTREINPQTMESRIVPGLFFAGELIDIDAKTGGYNLQAAFSTGWAAGRGLAR